MIDEALVLETVEAIAKRNGAIGVENIRWDEDRGVLAFTEIYRIDAPILR